jgi:cytochrome c553
VKIILLFSNASALEKFTKMIRIPEMIISILFLTTGVWLFVILGAIKLFHIIKLACIIISIPLAVVGFKKQKKSVALLSFILIVGAYGLAEMAKNKPFIPNKVVMNNSGSVNAELGIKTFAANCAMCHGLDGKKSYRDAADLSVSTLDPSLISSIVRDGSKGKMPAFQGTLSDEEIAVVSSYILALRK